MEVRVEPGKQRYVLIDALRGVACLAVVLFHAKEGGHIGAMLAAAPAWLGTLLGHGDSGVSVFFVISGFVIAHALLRDQISGGYVVRFILRRSVRLDPPYWAALALAVLAGWLSARLVGAARVAPPTWSDILLHLTYLVDLSGRPMLNAVYWTLCIEVQFYLSLVLLMWLAKGLGRHVGAQAARDLVLAACALVAALWVTPLAPFHLHGLFVERWYMFMAGVLVCRALLPPARAPARYAALLYLLLLALLLAGGRGSVADAAGLAAALLIFYAGWYGGLSTWSGGRVLQLLGLISYSLYLTHNNVTGATFRLAYRWVERTPLTEACCLVLVTLACCLFAWIFFLLFERPGLRWSKKISLGGSPRPTVVAPVPLAP